MLATLQYVNMGRGDREPLLDFEAQGRDVIGSDCNLKMEIVTPLMDSH